jgi:hypothetical protein
LQRGAAAAAELAEIPDTDEVRAADEAIVRAEYSDTDASATQFRAKIERIAVNYRDGRHRLDLANASPAELLAFCEAVEMEAWRRSDRSAEADANQVDPKNRPPSRA